METYVAITLMKLAMPASLRDFSHLFRVGKAITRQASLKDCSAL